MMNDRLEALELANASLASANAALSANERELLYTLNQVQGPVSRLDRDLRYRFVNDYFQHVFNKSRAEVIGRTIHEIAPRELIAEVLPKAMRALQGDTVEFECHFRNEAGREFFLYVHLVPEKDEGNNIVGLYVIGTDITLGKRMEFALEDREYELRLITNNIPCPISRMDKELRYQFVNSTFETLFGIKREEVIGNSMPDVVGDEVFARVKPFVDKVLKGEQTTFEFEVANASQAQQTFLLNFVPERDAMQNTVGFFAIGMDISDRKRAEVALRKNERELRIIANNVPGPVCRVDREFRYQFVNTYALDMVGKTNDQVVGKYAWEVIGQEAFEKGKPFALRALSGETVSFENCIQNSRGEQRYIINRMIPDTVSSNTIDSFFLIGFDITSLLEAERAREEIHASLAKFGSRIPGAFFQLAMLPDGSLRFRYASDKFGAIMGFPKETVPSTAMDKFEKVHAEDRAAVLESIRQSAQGLVPWDTEFRVGDDEQGHRWISSNAIPEREADGSILWHGYALDVTAKKKSELSLHIVTERLEQAQAMAKLGHWSYDIRTGRTYWSKQLYILFGRDPSSEPLGTPEVYQCFHPDDVPGLSQLFESAALTGQPYSIVRRIRKGDDWGYVRCEGLSRRNLHGEIEELVGTVTDVTDEMHRENALKLEREKAEVASRVKSEFLANMSHEIRTPLTSILGFTDVLLSDDEAIDRTATLSTIAKAGEHLLTIINDLLEVSKIEANKLTVEHEETRTLELIQDAIELVQQNAMRKGVRIDLQLITPIPDKIICDSTRLRQILLNLIGNAVKFTDHGDVRVLPSVRDVEGRNYLEVDVVDSGCGIHADQIDQLFQLFSQADNSLKRSHGGTGLGLHISKRFANLMGGDVRLVQSEVGRGSTFRVSIPIESPSIPSAIAGELRTQPVASTSNTAGPALKLNGRILLVEDGPDNQRLIAFHLRKAGATVSIADDGVVALKMIEDVGAANSPFDLILTDIQMPEMDGYELIKTLRQRGFNTPIIAITAHASAEDRQRCFDAGCNAYESKPINKNQLLETCHNWLGRKPVSVHPEGRLSHVSKTDL